MIYLFNKDERLIKVIQNDHIRSLYQTQTLSDQRYVSDKLEADIKALSDDEINQAEYAAIPYIEDRYKFHYYFLAKNTLEHNIHSITGVQAGIEELRKTPIYDIRPSGKMARIVIDQILQGTNWISGYVPDDLGEITANYYYTDAFSALKDVCERFGIEMQFFVEVNGNKLGARYIDFKHKIGKNIGKRIVYGHNALKIVQEVEKTSLVTALIGRGRGAQIGDDEATVEYHDDYQGPALISGRYDGTTLELIKDATKQRRYKTPIKYPNNYNGERIGRVIIHADGSYKFGLREFDRESEGYTRKITFEQIEWSKAKGDPVDKPIGQRFVEIPEATKKFGIKTPEGFRPKFGFVNFDIEDELEVLNRTYEALVEASRPLVLFKTSSRYLRDTGIGDVVRVVRHDRKIDYATRVIEITWNRLSKKPEAVDIKVGDFLTKSEGRKQSELTNEIAKRINQELEPRLTQMLEWLPSADGFNRNWYTSYDPMTNPTTSGQVRINDTWWQPDPEHEGHTIVSYWTGEVWKELLRTKDWGVVEEKIKEMEINSKQLSDSIAQIQNRNEQELADFKEEVDTLIKEFDFDVDIDEIIQRIENGKTFEEIKQEIESVRETSLVNAEMIGHDGITRYNKNLLLGDFKRTVDLDTGQTEIIANDGGFKANQTYTLSFDAVCIPILQTELILNLVSPYRSNRQYTLILKPRRQKLPDITDTSTVTRWQKQAYNDMYDLEVRGDWYKTTSALINHDGSGEHTVTLAYRDRIVGDTQSQRVLVWGVDNDIELKGVISLD